MFSLIITLLSIALVAAIAVATLYYGGSAFTGSGRVADVATIQNEASQIKAAIEGYRMEKGGLPTGSQEDIKAALIDAKYLKAFPEKADWNLENGFVVTTDLENSLCRAVNASYGIELAEDDPIPACDDPAYEGRTMCCDDGL